MSCGVGMEIQQEFLVSSPVGHAVRVNLGDVDALWSRADVGLELATHSVACAPRTAPSSDASPSPRGSRSELSARDDDDVDDSGGFCPLCLECCGVRWAVSVYTGFIGFYLIFEVSPAFPALDLELVQHLAVLLVAACAILGAGEARARPAEQAPGTLEARPVDEQAEEYQFYARLVPTISTVLELEVFADEPKNVDLLAALLFYYPCSYMVNFAQFHVAVKISGDILLGLHALILRSGHVLLRYTHTFSKISRGILLECKAMLVCVHTRRPNLWDHVCANVVWRFVLAFCMLTFLFASYMLAPDSNYKQTRAAGRESGFALIGDSSGLAPFQAFMNLSWLDKSTRDSATPKAKSVHVTGVLQLLNFTDQLFKYKATKKSLHGSVVRPISTIFNPERLHPWSLEDPMCEGVRTTCLLHNGSMHKVLDRLYGHDEDTLDTAINEVVLFHGTPSFERVKSIMVHGLRIDLSGSNRGASFGPGAYFSDMASKCDDFTSYFHQRRLPAKTKFMILCKVALGNTKTVQVGDESEIGLVQENHSKFGMGFRYNEYIIGNGSQAYCPYAVVYKDAWTFIECVQMAWSLLAVAIILVSGFTYRVNRIFPPEGDACWSC